MKEGDNIYCKKTYITTDGHIWVTENRIYTIIKDSQSVLCIIDDENEKNYSVMIAEYFDTYFLKLTDYRKLKLKKIYERKSIS